jgi:hypothetical protein
LPLTAIAFARYSQPLPLPYITIEAYSGVEVVVALEKQQSATVMIEKKICIKQKINSRDRAKK